MAAMSMGGAEYRMVMRWHSRGQLRNGTAMIRIAAAQFCLAIIRRGMVMRVQAVHDGAEQRLGIASDRVVFRWHGLAF